MDNVMPSRRSIEWLELLGHAPPETEPDPTLVEGSAAGLEGAGVVGSDLMVRAELAELRGEVQSLRTQGALFRSMMEATTDAVFAKDLRGRYIYINAAGARSLQRSPEAIIGRTDWELFGAHEAAVTVARDSGVFASGR